MARRKAPTAARPDDAAPPATATRAPGPAPRAPAPAVARGAGRGARFWFGMALFQLAFGFSVFVLTRAHYDRPSAVAARQAPPALPAPESTPVPGAADPTALGDDALRQRAGAAFTRGEYLAAAGDYTVLVTRQPRDVEMLNNLAISLHFAGRSAEGLARIREGLALQPGHQRSLLTLGFIQRAVGELDAARTALQRAIDADPQSGVGLEAARLLGEL